MLLTLLLTACSAPTTLGADILTELDGVRAELTSHQAAVDAAGDMDMVTELESEHHDAMAAMMAEMSDTMGTMMGCGMDGMMMDAMSDADTHMGEMSDEVDAHEEAHGSHADMNDCMGEEDDYAQRMGDHLDSMAMDMDGFDDSAQCSGGGGGGGGGMM